MVLFQARQLVSVCESSLVEEGVQIYEEARKEKQHEAGTSRPYSDPGPGGLGLLTVQQQQQQHPSPDKSWKWSGTDFIKSPTEEPWVIFAYRRLPLNLKIKSQ